MADHQLKLARLALRRSVAHVSTATRVGMGLMTILNLIALYPLASQALDSLKDYELTYRK